MLEVSLNERCSNSAPTLFFKIRLGFRSFKRASLFRPKSVKNGLRDCALQAIHLSRPFHEDEMAPWLLSFTLLSIPKKWGGWVGGWEREEREGRESGREGSFF